ncbi:MAG: carboxypeptidase-like regulatory domain-containing protein, partial [Bryobacteraceae bacterium]
MFCRWFLFPLAVAHLAAQTVAGETAFLTIANTGCVLVAQEVPPAIAASQGALPSDKSSVEGQVLNQRTDAPLAGAQVKLAGSDGSRVSSATDRKGRFSFSGLEAGQYRVEAERTGFVSLAWNKMVLTLAAGEQLKDIAVRLTPQAVVSGVVLDADGVPMANVSVAVRRSSRGSKRAMESAGAAQSNDAGE